MTSDTVINTNVTGSAIANDAARTNDQGLKLAEDFNQFLILLTTQIQNQDPLNPMDTTEFTNQLVQFTQVEQAINTNQKIDNLVAMQFNTQTAMALGFIGTDINYQSGEAYYDGSTPAEVTYALDRPAISASISVYDEDGSLIYTEEVERGAGLHEFTWDGTHVGGGTVGEGSYSIVVNALDSNDDIINASTVVTGRVHGVETQNGVINLLVGDRAVPIGNVINANLAAEAEVAEDDPVEDETGEEETT